MKKKTILVVDGGGRGSVLVDKYSQSPHINKIIAVPGNDMMQIGQKKRVETYPRLKTTSLPEILAICQKEKVSLVDVAQDNAVEAGLVNALQKMGIPVVGPTKKAGQIEWDKSWAREFCQRQQIPQPGFKIFHSRKEGIKYLRSQPEQQWFVKAAGLAEGKGALPAKSNKEAEKRISELKERFGKRANTYLVEKWLTGEEFSTFAFCDGNSFKIIGSAQDHKRVNDFDEGENTGGMGCSSPPLLLTPQIMSKIEKDIITRTISGLKEEGRPYCGVLYLGGIMVDNNPFVIEFNARWGDPEAQVILPGLKNDLFEIGMAIVEGELHKLEVKMDEKSRVVVAGTSRGYPGNYDFVKGKQIFGLDKARKIKGIKIYGAGIKILEGKYFASGGRLFYIVGEGNNVIEARQKTYQAMAAVSVEGNNLHFRTDIGWRDVEYTHANDS